MSIQVRRIGSSESLGQILPSGQLVDGKGRTIGLIRDSGELFDRHGEMLGRISNSGEYINREGARMTLILQQTGEIQIGSTTIGRISNMGWGIKIPRMTVAMGAMYLIVQSNNIPV